MLVSKKKQSRQFLGGIRNHLQVQTALNNNRVLNHKLSKALHKIQLNLAGIFIHQVTNQQIMKVLNHLNKKWIKKKLQILSLKSLNYLIMKKLRI